MSRSERIIHRFRRGERRRQNGGVLVIGRNEHIDDGQSLVLDLRRRLARQRIGVDDEREEQHRHAIELRSQEQRAAGEADRIGKRRQGGGDAPIDIAQHDEQRERDEQLPRLRTVGEFPQQPPSKTMTARLVTSCACTLTGCVASATATAPSSRKERIRRSTWRRL